MHGYSSTTSTPRRATEGRRPLAVSAVLVAALSLGLAAPDLALAAGKGKGKGQGHGQGNAANVQTEEPGSEGKKKGHGQGQGQGVSDEVHAEQTLDELISATEEAAILGYLQQYPGTVGSADSLPPGIAMNLARGKPLPPGIAKQQLPANLLTQLPARPGYEWWAVGDDIVLTNIATGIVVDLIAGIL